MEYYNVRVYEKVNIEFNLPGVECAETIISTEAWSTNLFGMAPKGNLVELMRELYAMYPDKSSCRVEIDDEIDMGAIEVYSVKRTCVSKKNNSSHLTVYTDNKVQEVEKTTPVECYILEPFDVDCDLFVAIQPTEEDSEIIKFIIPFKAFAKAIILAVDKMLEEYGFVGYAQTWIRSKGIDLGAYMFLKSIACDRWTWKERCDYQAYKSNFQDEIELLKLRLEND